MRKLAASLGFAFSALLSGCSLSTPNVMNPAVVPTVRAQGIVHGGQPPVTGATIQLYGLVPSGGGLVSSALIGTTVTTSDGTGVVNSNANAGNANNTLAAGSFTISGDYTCPASDPLVYLTATGGNPGLGAGTNNAAIVMMAALTDCNTLKNNAATTFVFVDEVTTIGTLAALYPYASSTGTLSATSGQVSAFNTAFGQVAEYTNTTTGSAPGQSVPGGYYASSTEINTLGNIVAPCVNSNGTDSNCSTLFNLTKSGGVAPTNTAGAIVNILNNPTQNASSLFALGGSISPFQPVLSAAPTSWSLPILQIAATPSFSIAGGTYSSAQFVTLSDTTSGAVIHYTTDGSTPTSASPTYSGTITVSSASETINAIALASGFATSAVASAAYTITGSTSTYTLGGSVALANNCGGSAVPTMTVTLMHSAVVVQTTTTDGSGNFSFSGVPNGSYTVTPSISGPSSAFYPLVRTPTVSGGNFTMPPFFVNLGYTVSGNVAYSGSKTGQIYLELNPTSCGGGGTTGTSLSAKGAYTIRGVPPGSYTLQAFMDSLGTGVPSASNATGSTSVTLSSANLIGQNVTLTDPSTVTITSAPTIQGVSGFNSGIVAQYKPVTSNGVDQATSYTLQWSTSPTFATVTGFKTFASNGTKADAWFLNGLTDASVYYFRAYGSSAGTAVGPYSNIYGPVTIGAPTGGNTVSGSVTFSQTPTGPMYVGFLSQTNGNFYSQYIASPVSAQAYTVQVPSDSYHFFAVLDQNGDGLIDAGDVQDATDGTNNNASVVISGATTNQNLTLPNADGTAVVTTQNFRSTTGAGVNQNYNLNFQVNGLVKQPVAVTLVSGPKLINPVDIGICTGASNSCGHGFQINLGLTSAVPAVGDTYTFNVTYSDASTGTLTATVTAVVSVLATGLSPTTGSSVSTTPTLSWTDPANASNYTYQMYMNDNVGNTVWQVPGNNSNANGFSSTTTSLVWGVDPNDSSNTPSPATLSTSVSYSWSVTVQDSNGNSSVQQVQYQP